MSYVVNKFVMIARRATKIVVILRSREVQRSKRTNFSQPGWAQTLRAVCDVRLLAKGATIRSEVCRASYPANLMCVVMRTYSVLP